MGVMVEIVAAALGMTMLCIGAFALATGPFKY